MTLNPDDPSEFILECTNGVVWADNLGNIPGVDKARMVWLEQMGVTFSIGRMGNEDVLIAEFNGEMMCGTALSAGLVNVTDFAQEVWDRFNEQLSKPPGRTSGPAASVPE